jgi:hypothetical protein
MTPAVSENKDITMAIYKFGKTGYFTENQVSGSIADACLADLRINNFAFNGIPRIKTERNPSDEVYSNSENFGSRDTFRVTLSTDEISSSIDLSYAEARAHAVRFKNNEKFENQLLKIVQSALQELEATASGSAS